MKKKLLAVVFVVFVVIACSVIYFKNKSYNRIDLQTIFERIERKLPEVEKINFRLFEDKGIKCYFIKDTLALEYAIYTEKEQMWHSIASDKKYSTSDIQKEYLEDFNKARDVSIELRITEIEKNPDKSKISFSFNLNILSTESIPNWDEELSDKIDRYNGAIIYDSKNNNENDEGYFKIKDNWYFEYYERRPR